MGIMLLSFPCSRKDLGGSQSLRITVNHCVSTYLEEPWSFHLHHYSAQHPCLWEMGAFARGPWITTGPLEDVFIGQWEKKQLPHDSFDQGTPVETLPPTFPNDQKAFMQSPWTTEWINLVTTLYSCPNCVCVQRARKSWMFLCQLMSTVCFQTDKSV